jgi:hypothetical protein
MPLTLRPTRLSRNPDANEWSIHEDGAEIGRLYEDCTASRPELTWFWSITVMGPARDRVKTDGRAPTFEDAKVQFARPGRPSGGRQRTRIPRHECGTHRLAGTPRATKPPWNIEAVGVAHDPVEATALLPFSMVTPPCSIMAVSGPFRVKTWCVRE